jgi:hypothetical protein
MAEITTTNGGTHGYIRRGLFTDYITSQIVEFRKQWEEAAQLSGTPIDQIQAPVALIIADLGETIGLTDQDIQAALGPRLYQQIHQYQSINAEVVVQA